MDDPYRVIESVEPGSVFRKEVIPPGEYPSEHPLGSVIVMKRRDPADPSSLICGAIFSYEKRNCPVGELVRAAWPDARDVNTTPDHIWRLRA